MDHGFPLKPYQAAAAERIIQEFSSVDPGRGRDAFVLADEAGLGKTFIALQVIADMYTGPGPGERQAKDRLNVYYMCSNQRILKQNGDKLERYLSGKYPVVMPPIDRLSQAFFEEEAELPKKQASQQDGNGIYLYTMSASLLDTTRSSGRQDERQSMLEVLTRIAESQAKNGASGKAVVPKDLVFLQILKQHLDQLFALYPELVSRYPQRKQSGGQPETAAEKQAREAQETRILMETVVGEWIKYLRKKLTEKRADPGSVEDELARALGIKDSEFEAMRSVFNAYSIAINPPHLIILDEFHKMDGMEKDSTKALGALRKLIDGKGVKQLYLSATPYRFTIEDRTQLEAREERSFDLPEEQTTDTDKADPENDSKKEGVTAFQSFDEFVRFFLPETEADEVIKAFHDHEKSLENLQKGAEDRKVDLWKEAARQAEELAKKLQRFMTRSERDRLVSLPPEEYRERGSSAWRERDLLRIAEDWQPEKAAYLRQIPGVYSFALRFNYEDQAFNVKKGKASSGHRYKTLVFSKDYEETDYLWGGSAEAGRCVLNGPKEESWQNHPKLRTIDETTVQGMEQLLWMPPVRPYYQAEQNSAYGGMQAAKLSKLLVFSNYQFIPRALGSLFSETVLQRNKEQAGNQLLDESVITSALNLPMELVRGEDQNTAGDKEPVFDDVKSLAELVSLKDLRCPKLTCDQLVERLYWYKCGEKGRTKEDVAAAKEVLWQAIGSPQVCLYRLMEDGFHQLDKIMDQLAPILAERLLTWSRELISEPDDRNPNQKYFVDLLLNYDPSRKEDPGKQTKNRWNWYFYAKPYESKYAYVRNNSLKQYRYEPYRSQQSNLWWWMVEAAFPLLKKENPKPWKKLEDICCKLTGQEKSKQGCEKAMIAFAGCLVENLKSVMEKALCYEKKTHTWDTSGGKETLIPIVKESFKRSARKFMWMYLADFEAYFKQESIRWALSAAGVKNKEDLFRYCANGNLQSVLEEYLFLCGNDPWEMASRLKKVLNLEGSKVHVLNAGIDTAKNSCCSRLGELLARLEPTLEKEDDHKMQLRELLTELNSLERMCCDEVRGLLTQLREKLSPKLWENTKAGKAVEHQKMAEQAESVEQAASVAPEKPQCCQYSEEQNVQSCAGYSAHLRKKLKSILEEPKDKKLSEWVKQLEHIARSGKPQLPHVGCSFSERYTADVDDANSHNHKWEEAVQDAFNSPFWPMILTTTSVAQEGLDFHQYCRRIMHYTLPQTPMALEQREGRIDRFRGYIQRLRQAERMPDLALSWKELFEDEKQANGVIPGWVVPKEKETFPDMERLLAFLPGTAEAIAWERLKDAKRHYRNAIGMPDDLALIKKLEDICEQLNRKDPTEEGTTPRYQLADLFPNLTPL